MSVFKDDPEGTPDNVVKMPEAPRNRACPECGGEWWNIPAVMMGIRVVGLGPELECRACGHKEEL